LLLQNILAPHQKINKTKIMRRFLSLLSLLVLSYAPSLMACEGCKEPSNVAGDSGVAGISASFSWSVLFMIGMLGLLISCLVVMMIRSCKQLAQHQQVSQTSGLTPSPSSRPIRNSSPTSLAGFGSPMPAGQL
jgi:hypothetical protein